MIHTLKTVNPYFTDVWNGFKTFEIRKNDRGYQIGDTLQLDEYDARTGSFSGKRITVEVLHLLTHEDFPDVIQPGYACLSIKVLSRIWESDLVRVVEL